MIFSVNNSVKQPKFMMICLAFSCAAMLKDLVTAVTKSAFPQCIYTILRMFIEPCPPLVIHRTLFIVFFHSFHLESFVHHKFYLNVLVTELCYSSQRFTWLASAASLSQSKHLNIRSWNGTLTLEDHVNQHCLSSHGAIPHHIMGDVLKLFRLKFK